MFTTYLACNAADYIGASAADVVHRSVHRTYGVACNGSSFVQDFAVCARYFVAEVEILFLVEGSLMVWVSRWKVGEILKVFSLSSHGV